MREINHNARLKGVNQKFEPRQSETFVRGRTKVFKKAGSVRKRFLPLSSPSPYFSFFAFALFLARPETGKIALHSLETLATQASFIENDSSAWHSPRPGLIYDHRPSHLLPRRVLVHSFKRQLHSTLVVAVGWEPQNSSRQAYGDGIS